MNSGVVGQAITLIIGMVGEFVGLIFTDLELWQTPIGYYIIGFIFLGIAIDYILR